MDKDKNSKPTMIIFDEVDGALESESHVKKIFFIFFF